MFSYSFMAKLSLFIVLLFLPLQIKSQIYVSTEGNDSNSGSFENPYLTITKGISVAVPGDTIYVRGGTYLLTSTISISSSKSGNENQMYYLMGYENERPLLDFSNQAFGSSSRGIKLSASYWYIKRIDIKGAGDNGMQINGGSHNTVENCSFFENRDTGLQLSGGASFNSIINCDSYYNADPTDYGDADGFAPKLDVGTGNYFYGCRSWSNCDDGWDGYMRGANDITTTLENCWTWKNGYFKDGTDPGSQANGNGFKMGGGDNSNSDQLMHHFILKNCVAFENKAKGFDQNNNVGSMTLYNCTAFHNLVANFRVMKELNTGQQLTVKNCVSYSGNVELGSFSLQETNSWMSPFQVTESDFVSVDYTLAESPRKADGSLPDIDFMKLAEGSGLINAGVDVGLPYNGAAPDLGAFESDYSTGINEKNELPSGFYLYQNYPNPFNPVTAISYQIPSQSFVVLKIYDVLGSEVAVLISNHQNAGLHYVTFDAGNLSSGIYYYSLQADGFHKVKKLMVLK